VARPVRVAAVFATPTGDLSIFRFLAERPGLELRVLFTHPDRSGRGGAGEAGFAHMVLPSRTLRRNEQTAVDQVWNPGLARALAEVDPDVLFVGGYGTVSAARATAWAARRGVPRVVYSESWGTARGSPARRWAKRRALDRVLGGAAGFVTYGRRGEEYLRHFGARAPVLVIGSNRDLRAIAEAADAARGRPGKAFLFVGRLVEAKGVDVLLEAFRAASPDLPGWRLALAGDGPLRGLAERAAADLPVDVLGPVPFERIAEAFAGVSVFVLPSRQEPWGQVVPEAMAAGVPVISSDAVGAAEHFVDPRRTGWIVPAGDPRALAAAMRDAAAADLVAMGAAARERALPEDAREAAARIGELLVEVGSSRWR
jgi:glycosyltransferase involved in cell wall biosynthesis